MLNRSAAHKSSQWQRIGQILSLFCVCLFLVISCSHRPAPIASVGSQQPDASNGRITIGTTLKPKLLDPADAYEIQSLGLIYNMSDRLYTYKQGTTELIPQLATALPKVSSDGLTYIIPVRKNVVFHDGTAFNAAAMAFSLQRFIQNAGKPSFLLSDVVTLVKATGEYELTIKLKKPFAAFPSLLAFAGACAVSPKAYEIGVGKFKPDIFVGTGPYKLAQYNTDSLRFDVFDKYWGEKPANRGINLQIFNNNSANLYNSFRTGAVDVAYLSLDPDQIRSLAAEAKNRGYQVSAVQGNVVNYLILNSTQKPLDNPAIRQAIAMTMDRQLLNQRVLYGQAEPLYSLIPTTLDVYRPVFKDKYGDGDIEKAKQLLHQSGYSQTNPLKLELWYEANQPTWGLAAVTLEALAKQRLGGLLKFELNAVEATTAFKELGKGIYPTFLLDWYPDFLDPDNYIEPFLACEKGSKAKGCEQGASQTQGAFYYSERTNQLINQERQEQNPKQRQKIFAEIQDQLAQDIPYIPLWQNKDYVFGQKGITGIDLSPTQFLPYLRIREQG
ncbi:MAG: peptide ABC transporter substrate-binding protein [Chroococcidiopsidaceae cyanobacterium CP_BM_RX_35]|nr:peptide ABC transporter substrate-binding protein [Chroococcidiopsidaceae cyanobacterium CP_BM_RX_35]